MVMSVECACGKMAFGSHAMLATSGWRWSAAFHMYLCKTCFAGVLAICRDYD